VQSHRHRWSSIGFSCCRGYAGLSGEIISTTITGLGLTAIDLKSSCADLFRASTSLFQAFEEHGWPGQARPRRNPRVDLLRYAAARFSPDSPAGYGRRRSAQRAVSVMFNRMLRMPPQRIAASRDLHRVPRGRCRSRRGSRPTTHDPPRAIPTALGSGAHLRLPGPSACS
jgi:hypothetical protein